MNPSLQRYIDAASGFTTVTAKKADQIARSLVRSGAAASDQLGEIAEDLVEKSRKNREVAAEFVKRESERAVKTMGLVRKKEIDTLQKQVSSLKSTVSRLEREVGLKTGRTSTAKKATAKKATAKKATAKKATAKKATAKKTTAGGAASSGSGS
ncbi:MAG: hypothetical protein WD007_01415 [Nitriliruptoraceae bacterium]